MADQALLSAPLQHVRLLRLVRRQGDNHGKCCNRKDWSIRNWSSPIRCIERVLAQHWWTVGLRDVLAIIFESICLLTPGIAVRAFVIVFAAYMFVDGVFAIISGVHAARGGEQRGLLSLEGVVDLIIACCCGVRSLKFSFMSVRSRYYSMRASRACSSALKCFVNKRTTHPSVFCSMQQYGMRVLCFHSPSEPLAAASGKRGEVQLSVINGRLVPQSSDPVDGLGDLCGCVPHRWLRLSSSGSARGR